MVCPPDSSESAAPSWRSLCHQGLDGRLIRLANILTFGRYTHREKVTPELLQQLDKERQLAYHTRFLRQVARSTPIVEVAWKMEEVLASLRYVSENGSEKDNESAKVVGSIFSRTEDVQARELCLSTLKKIGNKVAMREILRIYHDATVPAEWRAACAEYLRNRAATVEACRNVGRISIKCLSTARRVFIQSLLYSGRTGGNE